MVAFYRVSLVSTRFYLVLLGFIISLWVVMVLPRFLPSFIRFHRVFISSYWISLGSTSSYQVLPSSLGFTSSFTVIISFHWISLGFSGSIGLNRFVRGFDWVPLGFTELYLVFTVEL